MPLPLILGIGATIAGLAGAKSGIQGAVKMKEANDVMELAQNKHERSIKKFEKSDKRTKETMDKLGELELNILKSFDSFSEVFEKIKNKPSFEQIVKETVDLPKYDPEEIKKASVGAALVLGGLGGAAAGTAGGIAAAGATTAVVMSIGTASTGTAIASLSGAAATNAALAAIGGGALSAGGGGIALGTTILGASTLGVGLLVGGAIFNATGSKLSDKADEAYNEAKKQEKLSNKICAYLDDLNNTALEYITSLKKVQEFYQIRLDKIRNLVYEQNKIDYRQFTEEEQKTLKNLVSLVALLYKMCKVNLVKKSCEEDDINEINKTAVNESIKESEKVILEVA